MNIRLFRYQSFDDKADKVFLGAERLDLRESLQLAELCGMKADRRITDGVFRPESKTQTLKAGCQFFPRLS